MSNPEVPVVPPADPPAPAPAPAPAPEPKAAEKKLLDDLKKAQSKAKELEAKLAEALPYVEKFRGHDEAKALEAQREAEARANQEKEQKAQQEVAAKKERAILRTLLGVPMPTEDAADYAFWKLVNDPAVVYDPESGTFTGLTEAKAKLLELPLFAAGKPAEPTRKVAPGLPVTTPGTAVESKFSTVKTFTDLVNLGAAAVREYFEKYPDKYALLKAGQKQGLESPTRVIPPAAMRSN